MTGQQIINEICARYWLHPDEVRGRGKRSIEVTAARREVIELLREEFSIRQIATLLGVNYSTVVYHLYEARRQNVQRNARACYARKRAA